MNEIKDLNKRQIDAIRRSIELGRRLQQEHPQISEIYRSGRYVREIVKDLNIMSEYNVSYNVAQGGVRYALVGNRDSLKSENYDGLLSLEEAFSLGKEHMSLHSMQLHKEKRRVHGMTNKERSELGRRFGKLGGKIAGRKAYEEKRGIHGRTKEQMIADGKKGGRKAHEIGNGIFAMDEEEKRESHIKATLARGHAPWPDDEMMYAYGLSLSPEYRYSNGPNMGKLRSGEIARALNEKYHDLLEVRTATAVSKFINKYKISLEKRVS